MIDIDDRIGAVELSKHLPKDLVNVERLKYGDARFFGNGPDGPVPVGVERKRIHDLIQSMEDGRLSGHQLVGLVSRYQVVYILVEGIWRTDPVEGVLQTYRKGSWRPLCHGKRAYMTRDIINYLNTLEVLCGVHVWRSDTIQASCHWLLGLYRWWQKDWSEHKSHLRFQTNVPMGQSIGLKKPTLLRRILQQLPGVGWERAKTMESHFTSILDLVLADEKELQAIPGIGKKMAKNIRNALQGGG